MTTAVTAAPLCPWLRDAVRYEATVQLTLIRQAL